MRKNQSTPDIHTEWLNCRFGYFYTVTKRIHACKTRFQNLELVDTDEFGRVLLLDGITQVAQTSEFQYHEPMVHPAMCSHPCPKNVLVIGAGDGGILREVVKYPCVKSVVLAELDEGVIDFSRKYLPSIHDGAFRDPRLSIEIVDGRKYVEAHPKTFDVIIMDMTDPFGPSKYLYTKDFFTAVKQSFSDSRGVFCMHTESPIARPKTFSCIQHTLKSVFTNTHPFYSYIQMYATLWSITVASEGTDTYTLKPAAIDKKLASYKIRNLQFYNGAIHQAAQAEWPYITDILTKKSRVLTDRHPDIPDEILHN